jgi:hypothetical protein
MYKPNSNAVSGLGASIPCQQSPCCCSLFKTLEIRASVIKDMKSWHAVTTACKLFALFVSTLLVKCSSATCKVLVTAVYFLDDLSGAFITADHMSDEEGADKQAWSLLPIWASILHACSLHASMQDSLFNIHMFVRVGGKCGCTLVSGTQDDTQHWLNISAVS